MRRQSFEVGSTAELLPADASTLLDQVLRQRCPALLTVIREDAHGTALSAGTSARLMAGIARLSASLALAGVAPALPARRGGAPLPGRAMTKLLDHCLQPGVFRSNSRIRSSRGPSPRVQPTAITRRIGKPHKDGARRTTYPTVSSSHRVDADADWRLRHLGGPSFLHLRHSFSHALQHIWHAPSPAQ